jgi:hypothetical protein
MQELKKSRITAIRCILLLAVLGLASRAIPAAAQTITSPTTNPGPAKPLLLGSTYYVATTGDDNHSGSAAAPWRTIQKAANTLVAGDTVYIRAGTYAERVQPQNSGSGGAYITFSADSGAVVTIDGSGISIPNGLDGLISIAGKSYIKISNLRVINSQGAGIRVDSASGTPSSNIVIQGNYTHNTVSSGIGVWNSNHITVDGNQVELANNDGSQENLTIATTDTFEIMYNHVHDGGPGTNGGEGIDIKDGSSNGLVHHNQVDHIVNRVGILVDAWDKHEYNIEIYQNLIHHNANYGMSIGSEAGGLLETIKVYNNLIYSNYGYGITIRPDGSSLHHPVKDVTIINNTFANNGPVWGGGMYIINPEVQNLILRNNLLSQNLEFQIVVDAVVPANQVTIDHNLIDGYRGYPGETYGTTYVTGNPKFTNPASNDFHLQFGSPAIDTGSLTGAPATDYASNLRPFNATGIGTALPDIGAYEYGARGANISFLPLILHAALP